MLLLRLDVIVWLLALRAVHEPLGYLVLVPRDPVLCEFVSKVQKVVIITQSTFYYSRICMSVSVKPEPNLLKVKKRALGSWTSGSSTTLVYFSMHEPSILIRNLPVAQTSRPGLHT